MSDFKLDIDGDGDLVIENGDLVLVDGSEAVRQNLLQNLRMFRGEWFLAQDQGVPYYENILIKNPNPDVVDGALKSVIINTPGVLELLSFTLDYDDSNRRLTLDFEVRVSDGTLIFNDALGG